MRFGHRLGRGRFLGCLVLLCRGKDKRGIVLAFSGHGSRLPIGKNVCGLGNVPRVKGQAALAILGADSACGTAAVATVEDHSKMNSLVQGSIEDPRHVPVADIVAALGWD